MANQVDNTFTWVIKNLSSSPQIVSEPFIIGGCKWHLTAYPEVIEAVDYISLSLYLDVADCESLPSGWKRHAKFSITIVNQYSEERCHLQETQQWFDEKTTGWGFPPMINLLDCSKEHDGFLLDDEVIVVATVDVLEVIGTLDESEKSETFNVNGFQVLPSQEKSVNGFSERDPEVVSGFSIKNQSLKTSSMNVPLSLTETLHQSPKEISMDDDLSDAETTLVTEENVGFKLEWLKGIIEALLKEKEACEVSMRKVEEEFEDLKEKYSGLEALLKKVKPEVFAARNPFSSSFVNDDRNFLKMMIVCTFILLLVSLLK